MTLKIQQGKLAGITTAICKILEEGSLQSYAAADAAGQLLDNWECHLIENPEDTGVIPSDCAQTLRRFAEWANIASEESGAGATHNIIQMFCESDNWIVIHDGWKAWIATFNNEDEGENTLQAVFETLKGLGIQPDVWRRDITDCFTEKKESDPDKGPQFILTHEGQSYSGDCEGDCLRSLLEADPESAMDIGKELK